MMRRLSIGVRLTAWYTAILAVTFAIAGGGVWLGLRRSVNATVDGELRSRLASSRLYVERQLREGGAAGLAKELEEDGSGLQGADFRIADAHGRWMYQSPNASTWGSAPPAAPQLPDQGVAATYVINRKTFRVLSAPMSVGTVQLAVPLEAYDRMMDAFFITAMCGSPLLLAVAAGAGYWLSRRALEPVDAIARSARLIGARNLTDRLPISPAHDQLRRLSVTLNEMLERLEGEFTRTRQFTADASHELRTPIAVIHAFADVIAAKSRSVEDHEQAWRTVRLHTERLSRMIDDLLLLARSDDPVDVSRSEPTDLAELIRDTCRDMQVMATHAGLALSYQLPDSCTANTQSEAIRRLLAILLDNAIKYTPAGGEVRVTLSTRESATSPSAAIEVCDTGIGIAAEDLPRVFDRFYRTSKDRSRTTGGAGLGLAIAHSIVARLGGSISVTSQPAMGSRFHVEIPR